MRFNRRARLTKPGDEGPAFSGGSAKRGGGGGRSRKAKSQDADSSNVPKENMLVCSGSGSSSDEGVAEVHSSSSSSSSRSREISIPKSLLANADMKDLGNKFETTARRNIDCNLKYLHTICSLPDGARICSSNKPGNF